MSAIADETQVWNRLIRPDQPDLPPEAATFFLTLAFSEADRDRMHELAVRNQNDELTIDEKSTLESYRRVAMQLDILQAKARLSLRRAAG